MCGLFGAFRADNCSLPKISPFMWQGLYISGLRGMGGTGVGLVYPDFRVDLAKSHASAPFFLYSEEWDWVDKNVSTARAVLGHTRSATQGVISTKNAHPFIADVHSASGGKTAVMQIHNGTIGNWASLTPNSFSHQVDSAHANHAIANKGALETLREIEGGYVLIWYDEARQVMRMARNAARELFYAQDKDKKYLWFASELDFLVAVLRRNNIEHVDSFWELDLETLYTFDLTKNKLEPQKEKYEKKQVRTYPSTNENGRQHYGGRDWWTEQQRAKIFTKPLPVQGDYIWMEVSKPDAESVTKYPTTQTSINFIYGYVIGSRALESNSIIRLNGIRIEDWETRLTKIRHELPVRITRVMRDVRNPELFNGEAHVFYEATLDEDETAWSLRKLLKDTETKERLAAATAAGRNLPVLSNSTQTPITLEPRNLGSIGPYTVVQPGDAGNDRSGGGLPGSQLPVVGPLNLSDKVPGPRSRQITFLEWKEVASYGCALCQGGKISTADIGKVGWFPYPCSKEDRNPEDVEYQMICPPCVSDPSQMQKIAAL